MKNNEDLQKDVQDAIKWEPLLNAAEIGVTVKDGVVTLTGIVDSYAKKAEAEEAARNVAGVKAVVEKIEIELGNELEKGDNEIANKVLNAFQLNWYVPQDRIKVKVESGWVTLDGELSWNYQKENAKRSICNLVGVKGVINNIIIKSEINCDIEKKDIERALYRNWSIDERKIEVGIEGNKVTLKGTVNSLYQKDQAGKIAYNAPGVWTVDNELLIEY